MDQDSELIDRYAAGDREAFNTLVEKHQKPLYALIYRMVSNHGDAADLLQKTFIKAFTGLSGFERRSSFKTWLCQIAINLAKNTCRDRAKVRHVSLDDVVIRKDPRTLYALIRKEHHHLLLQSIGSLPEKQRLTLMLRVQNGLKFEEISNIMQCSLGTAKANYHHAVQKMKTMREQMEAMRDLRFLLKAAKPDEAKIRSLLEKLGKNHHEIQGLKAQEIKGIRDFLTIEQQARFLLFQQEFQREMRGMISGARGKGRGKGGMGPGGPIPNGQKEEQQPNQPRRSQ